MINLNEPRKRAQAADTPFFTESQKPLQLTVLVK
jgi:hypothetical protein